MDNKIENLHPNKIVEILAKLMPVKPFFAPYTQWEDYLNGMYNLPHPKQKDRLVNLAVKLLTNDALFFGTGKWIIEHWPVSTAINLTSTTANKQAWLGQSCCCFAYSVPETCTRLAWGILTPEQQLQANNTADRIIDLYETKNKSLHSILETTGLPS